MRNLSALRVCVFVLLLGFAASCFGDSLSVDRSRCKAMLKSVAGEINKHFYDPTLKGVDVKQAMDEAMQKIDQSTSVNAMNAAIYEFTEKFDDSHTRFLAPESAVKAAYGFKAKPFGDEIRVYDLTDKGAAKRDGLRVGDRIMQVEGYELTRENYTRMMTYARLIYAVSPMKLVVMHPEGTVDEVAVKPFITKRFAVVGDGLTRSGDWFSLDNEHDNESKDSRTFHAYKQGDVGYVEIKQFPESQGFLQGLVGETAGRKALVVDLRECPGGVVKTLLNFAGMFENGEVEMGKTISREKTEPLTVKPQSPYLDMPVFVLVDSNSASGAEMLARHLQLRKKAVIIGDTTKGYVSEALEYSGESGGHLAIQYATLVTVAKVQMSDGKSLEKVGVKPDIACLPTGKDLAAEQDPCLSLAFSMAKKAIAPVSPKPAAAGN